MQKWSILCDFDGTIVDTDVIDSLLERFGQPGWESLERDWRAGRIGSRECMREQVALLDMDRAEFDRHLTGCRVDPSFPAFVRAAKALDVPLCVVSDGIDYAIRSILAHHGLDDLPLAANHLQALGNRQWQLTSPFQNEGCRSGTCKCAALERSSRDGESVLLIGDGASDFCAAKCADFVFAKHTLIDYCQANGIAHQPIADFDDAIALLRPLLNGELADAPALVAASF